MAFKPGLEPSLKPYTFGAKRIQPLRLEEDSEDELYVVLPTDWTFDSQPAAPAASAPIAPKASAWGKVPSVGSRPKRRGFILRPKLEDVVSKIVVSPKPPLFHPRGLHNSDRKCFLNTTVQSLLAIPHFYSLLSTLAKTNFTETAYPTLSRLVKLYNDFGPLPIATKEALKAGKTIYLPLGAKLTPSYMYSILQKFNPIASDWQEDMQEFLCFLLETLHSELLAAAPEDAEEDTDPNKLNVADEWSAVGGKNKAAVVVTDVSKFKQSAVSKIFGGEIQSLVRRKGAKSSMALEPFFCLHLDVASPDVSTLEDAFDASLSSEILDSSGISKTDSIKTLPPVLLIHLKRFAFYNGKSEKVTKPIYYPEHLSLKSKWLGSNFTTGRDYRLQSVTQHLGARAQGGHYTSYVRQCNDTWLLFDDAHVEQVDTQDVLDCANGYMLCYVRDEH